MNGHSMKFNIDRETSNLLSIFCFIGLNSLCTLLKLSILQFSLNELVAIGSTRLLNSCHVIYQLYEY